MEAVYVGLGIVVAYLLGGLRVLREYERGVYFFLGRLWGAKGPGLIFLPPLFARMQKVSLRVVAMDIPPQDVITRDNISIKVNAVLYMKVRDAVRAVNEVDDGLEDRVDLLPVHEQLVELGLAEHGPQRGLRELARGVEIVLDLVHRPHGVPHLHVEDGVHLDRDVVARDHVLRGDVHRHDAQGHLLHAGEQRRQEDEPRPLCAPQAAEEEVDAAFVLAQHAEAAEQVGDDDPQSDVDGFHGVSGGPQAGYASTITAAPWPPPMQAEPRPKRWRRWRRACSRWIVMRVPLAASGCPMAIAPPCTLVLARSSPSSRSTARYCGANASFTSTRSICSSFIPAFWSALRAAGAGPIPMYLGSTPATAQATSRPSGFRPRAFAKASLATTVAAAPSAIPAALPAVTRPSFLK